jgi:hypothetical protein
VVVDHHLHAPLDLLGAMVLEVESELDFFFLGAPQGELLRLVVHVVALLFVHAHDGCARSRHELLLGGHIALQVLALLGVVILAGGCRHLGHFVLEVVVLGLGALDVLVLEGGRVTQCRGMDFVELGDRDECCAEENVLEMDLSMKKNPKSVDLSDAILKMKSWKWRGWPLCLAIPPFEMKAWRRSSPLFMFQSGASRWRVIRCDLPKLHFLGVALIGRPRDDPW